MQWSEIQPFMGGTDPFHTVHSDRVAVTVTRVDPGQPDPFQPANPTLGLTRQPDNTAVVQDSTTQQKAWRTIESQTWM